MAGFDVPKSFFPSFHPIPPCAGDTPTDRARLWTADSGLWTSNRNQLPIKANETDSNQFKPEGTELSHSSTLNSSTLNLLLPYRVFSLLFLGQKR